MAYNLFHGNGLYGSEQESTNQNTWIYLKTIGYRRDQSKTEGKCLLH